MYDRTNEGATKGGRDDIPMYDRTNAGEGGQPEVHSQSTREAERSGILQHACKLPSILWEARMPAIHKNT